MSQRLYAEKCVVCGRGAWGLHIGVVPAYDEVVKRGPAKFTLMQWAAVCALECAATYRAADLAAGRLAGYPLTRAA